MVKVVTRTRSPRSTYFVDLPQEVVDLALDGPDNDLRVHQARWADDLFNQLVADLPLIGPGGCRDEDHLPDVGFEFGEGQRPVVQGRRQPEAEFHQGLFPGAVPAYMALIWGMVWWLSSMTNRKSSGK